MSKIIQFYLFKSQKLSNFVILNVVIYLFSDYFFHISNFKKWINIDLLLKLQSIIYEFGIDIRKHFKIFNLFPN